MPENVDGFWGMFVSIYVWQLTHGNSGVGLPNQNKSRGRVASGERESGKKRGR